MPSLTLPLTLEQFHQLPRHPAYRYEYLAGKAYLSPRARHCHGLLDLTAFVESIPSRDGEDGLVPPRLTLPGVQCRAIAERDWEPLFDVFCDAFDRIQPFGSLDDARLPLAAQESLQRTRTGGDGPLIAAASFVASETAAPKGDDSRLVGAILITLLPAGDPCEWSSLSWSEPAPADALERRLGRPHLTWIFVRASRAGQGVGTALLGAAAGALRQMGYAELLSTFMVGNDSSLLWHWRSGFRLLSQPASPRRTLARWRRTFS